MEPLGRNIFTSDPGFNGARQIPILSASNTSSIFTQPDAMDITPPASATLLPTHNSSPEAGSESQGSKPANKNGTNGFDNVGGLNGLAAGASATATNQQPKVVQTAFIHKLYRYVVLRLAVIS